MLPKSPSLNWTTESVDLSGPCDNTDVESDMIDNTLRTHYLQHRKHRPSVTE